MLVDTRNGGPAITRKAVSEAISAGEMELALRLIGRIPAEDRQLEVRLLLAGEAIRSGRPDSAVTFLSGSTGGELSFLNPFIVAWKAAERRDLERAVAAMAAVQAGNVLGGARDEHLALLLLKLGRTAEAEPLARKVLENAGGREDRLRLAFADGFLAAGDRRRASAFASELGAQQAAARRQILSGKPSGLGIDSVSSAYSELLLRMAIELNQLNNPSVPIALAQIARFVAPKNDSASLLLALFLRSRERGDEALEVLESIPAQSALAEQARDVEVRILLDSDRDQAALRVATASAGAPGAGASAFARLADTYSSLDRHDEAAETYGRAIALASDAPAEDRWPLRLLRASALEEAGRWPEAKAELNAALALAPDQPLILNFLGYAKLERGEDLDLAEAMIRKASALAPDDASITDSLGWALYKRGRLDQAIEVLQRAARADPGQSEIHEHLGDALYSAGRKFEARFAWQAALTTAESDVAGRIRAKIESGLTEATAAP